MDVMALQIDKLTNLILINTQAAIKTAYPTAVPTDMQLKIAKAIAGGFIQIMITKAIGKTDDGVINNPMVGPSIGMTGIDVDFAIKSVVAYMTSQIPSYKETKINKLMLKAIFNSVKIYFAVITNSSISGFGGQITQITGWSPQDLYLLIYQNMEGDLKVHHPNSKYGKIYFTALATGFTDVIQKKAKPTMIPSAPVPPAFPVGPLIAKFS